MTYVCGGAENADLIRQVTADVDEVYHLAAAVGVALVTRQPIDTIKRNIYPTQLVLDALRPRVERGERVKLFLASSSEVYGKNPKPAFSEEDDLVIGPTTRSRWSYGASKAIDEFMALACSGQHGLPVVVGRLFNVIGPRQTGAYGMVLPRFVAAALAGGPLTVHDDGRQVRCFAHVLDVVRWVLQLMDTPAAMGQIVNIGGDEPVEIRELARRVADAVDPSLRIEFQSYAEAYDAGFEDVRRRVPDLSTLRRLIDYDLTYSLDAIIREVIDEHRRRDEPAGTSR